MTGKKETIYAGIFSLSSKIIAYFLLLVIANLYIKESLGQVMFILSAFNLILIITVLGVPDTIIPWITKKKDTKSIYHSLMLFSILTTTITIIAFHNQKWAYPIFFMFPFILTTRFSQAYLHTKFKYHYSMFLGIIYTLTVLLLAILLKNLNALGLTIAYASGYLIESLIQVYLTREYIKEILKDPLSNLRIKLSTFQSYFKKGIATTLLTLSFAILGRIDSFILGTISTYENVASYNIASPITNVITLIPISIGLFLLKRTSEQENKKLLKKTIRISFSAALITAIILIIFTNIILKILFPLYMNITPYIAILAIGIVSYSAYYLISIYLIGKLKPERALLAISLSAILNIILDLILIPRFGLYGICIATTISHLTALSILLFQNKIGKKFLLIYPMLAIIPITYFAGDYKIVVLPISLVLLYLTRFIKKEDFNIIKDTINEIRNKHKTTIHKL